MVNTTDATIHYELGWGREARPVLTEVFGFYAKTNVFAI